MNHLLYIAWKEIFSTYSTVLLAIIGLLWYFIKRRYDLKTKKIEAKHSLFQQNKIAAVVNFFDCYSKVDRMWHALPIFAIYNREITAKEIDALLLPLTNFQVALLQLTLYLDKEEIKKYELIDQGFQKINRCVSDIFFNYSRDKNSTSETNTYAMVKADVETENKKLLELISKEIRQSFHS